MSRILVVEDEAHIAEGLQYNLEAEGHEVEVLADGPSAAERLAAAERPLDLVLLDVMLPGMSGFEVARRARAAGNYVPILILTAKDDAEDVVFRLSAISTQDGEPVALLNDRLVREGDAFGGVRILRIGATEIEIEVDGERRTIGF